MLTRQLTTGVPKIIRRNIGIVAPMWKTASDPIQKLFLDKLNEYKSKSTGGKLVDANPEIENERKTELEKLAQQYGGSTAQMSEFPKFNFTDPPVEMGMEKK